VVSAAFLAFFLASYGYNEPERAMAEVRANVISPFGVRGYAPCESGGIGRRAGFRIQCSRSKFA